MPTSAGLLMFRRTPAGHEVLLVHPGGPFFKYKDDSVWSIPKGEPAVGEDLLAAARREFAEETGFEPGAGPFLELGSVRQRGGKVVHPWAVEGDCDPAELVSNTFKLEWPPRSGQFKDFPEADRAAFFDLEEAKRKVIPAQAPLLERLEVAIAT